MLADLSLDNSWLCFKALSLLFRYMRCILGNCSKSLPQQDVFPAPMDEDGALSPVISGSIKLEGGFDIGIDCKNLDHSAWRERRLAAALRAE